MAFNRPTLTDLITRLRSHLNSRLTGVDSRLPYTVLNVFAIVIAGAFHLVYGYLDWAVKQLFPETADEFYLLLHGQRRGITRNAATQAQGNVIFTGTDAVDIPAGTEVQRADGVAFTTDALATIAGGTATVAVTAVVAAAAGNTLTGVTVTLTSPIAGINSNATVDAGGLTGGTDLEDIEAYRVRVTERWKKPTQGGNKDDYIAWAKETSGVTRAWSYPLENGDGTVVVRFMMDDAYADGIPLAGDVTTVQDDIDTKRPATADVTAAAPVAKAIAITLSITPDTEQIRLDVEAEIKDLFRRRAVPGGSILLSQINEAISIAEDEEDHTLTAPVANPTSLPSEILVVGVITWV